MANEVSVLFIVGKGRSGSTILGDVLGSIDGVFHAGELWRVWEEGLSGAHSCSCGRAVRDCAVWSNVFERVGATTEGLNAVVEPERVAARQRRHFTFGGLIKSATHPNRLKSDSAAIRSLMTLVYEATAAASRSRIIVDSSKWPLDPVLLDPPERIRAYGVHLVRDPRDVAASWRKEKIFPDTGQPMPTFNSLHTAASWTARNVAAEWVGRRIGNRMIRIRYEDFVEFPHRTLAEILDHIGSEASPHDLVGEDSRVMLRSGHTIMGNPSRFESGQVKLAPQPVTRKPSRTLNLLTLPLRYRYNYRP